MQCSVNNVVLFDGFQLCDISSLIGSTFKWRVTLNTRKPSDSENFISKTDIRNDKNWPRDFDMFNYNSN